MVAITILDVLGQPCHLNAEAGKSLMQAALAGNVAGIDADCSGVMSCGTCVVSVADEWLTKLPPPSEHELQMLEFSAQAGPNSRLSCQIVATPELEGMVLAVVQQ